MSATPTPTPATPKVSFWKKIENFFAKLFSSSTEKKIASLLTVVAPLIEEAAQLIGGPVAGTLTEDILGTVQSDFAAVHALVTSSIIPGTNGFVAHAENILQAVHTNLQELLDAADVKNSQHAATITGIVNTVDAELLAVFQSLGGSSAPAAS